MTVAKEATALPRPASRLLSGLTTLVGSAGGCSEAPGSEGDAGMAMMGDSKLEINPPKTSFGTPGGVALGPSGGAVGVETALIAASSDSRLLMMAGAELGREMGGADNDVFFATRSSAPSKFCSKNGEIPDGRGGFEGSSVGSEEGRAGDSSGGALTAGRLNEGIPSDGVGNEMVGSSIVGSWISTSGVVGNKMLGTASDEICTMGVVGNPKLGTSRDGTRGFPPPLVGPSKRGDGVTPSPNADSTPPKNPPPALLVGNAAENGTDTSSVGTTESTAAAALGPNPSALSTPGTTP